MAEKKKLGEILMDAELIDEFQLKSALGYQQKWGGRLGDVLVENHFITEDALLVAIQQQTGVALVRLAGRIIPDYLKKMVPLEMAEKHGLVPIGIDGEPGRPSETLVIAMSDPTDLNAVDEVSFSTGKRVKPLLASKKEIDGLIALQYKGMSPVSVTEPDASMAAAGLESSMLAQADLESPSGSTRAAPSSAGTIDDPFAELDSLGALTQDSSSAVSSGPAQSESVDSIAVEDPFAELDALSDATFGDDGIDIDLDSDGEQQEEELEELEVLEDLEIIEQNPVGPVSSSDISAIGAIMNGPEAVGPGKNPLDELPDLDPVSGDELQTPPESTLSQAAGPDEDPFLDGSDLDLDGVLGALNPDENGSNPDPDPDISAADAESSLSIEEEFEQQHNEVITVRSDPSKLKKAVPISDQVTTVVSLPVLPPDREQEQGEDQEEKQVIPAQADAPDVQGPEAPLPKEVATQETAQETAQETTKETVLRGTEPQKGAGDIQQAETESGATDDGITSDAMKELLSRVGLKKGVKGGQKAPGASAMEKASLKVKPGNGDQSDARTLRALIHLLVSKGIISKEELEQAKGQF